MNHAPSAAPPIALPRIPAPSSYSLAVLGGFQTSRKPLYGGTVDAAVKSDRRRKNRVARKSRKLNRRSS